MTLTLTLTLTLALALTLSLSLSLSLTLTLALTWCTGTSSWPVILRTMSSVCCARLSRLVYATSTWYGGQGSGQA